MPCLWRQKLKQSISSVSGKLTNLGLFFVENKDWRKVEIGWFSFFKEKITLKHSKIIRSSEPRCIMLEPSSLKRDSKVFSCEICEILENTYFYITPPVAAFLNSILNESRVIQDRLTVNCFHKTLHFRCLTGFMTCYWSNP